MGGERDGEEVGLLRWVGGSPWPGLERSIEAVGRAERGRDKEGGGTLHTKPGKTAPCTLPSTHILPPLEVRGEARCWELVWVWRAWKTPCIVQGQTHGVTVARGVKHHP